MSNSEIVRALKDKNYRRQMEAEGRMQLPENPAGLVELMDDELDGISGGAARTIQLSCGSSDCQLTSRVKFDGFVARVAKQV